MNITELNGRPLRLLIGGSPCTYWSIAQKNNRETEAEGLGWELFKNYLIAKEKFNPDLFLYENNKSASQAIKDQIVFEPVRIGDIGSNSQAHRVYSCYGKSVNLVANGGGFYGDDMDEFWIGFNMKNGEVDYWFSSYEGMCGYTFNEFYKADEIENKWDMNVQVNAMRYLNMLLDEGIVELSR